MRALASPGVPRWLTRGEDDRVLSLLLTALLLFVGYLYASFGAGA
jgi:uncharacterized membrane protein YqaE (UPF0057 family)